MVSWSWIQKKSTHILFVLSPFFLLGSMIIAILANYSGLADILIILAKTYAVLFFVVSSWIAFQMPEIDYNSGKEYIIKAAYISTATAYMGLFFLLPFLKETIGLWDNQFLNVFVSLMFANFGFYFLMGIYTLIFLIFGLRRGDS